MRIKVTDYIVDYFAEKGIDQVFTVVGGGAMHLNDSFGHSNKVKCIYNHHEQACAMAAEGYAKESGNPAIVCVTGGPGGLNTLNGVAGTYQDSIPMIVLCGQVKTTLLEKTSGLDLRTLGGQEFDIVSAVGKMTKYAETILDANKIKYHLDKAYYTSISGRKGPCLLDIPVDIQGSFVETDDLTGFEPEETVCIAPEALDEAVDQVVEHFIKSERPVLYAGNGIRLSGGIEEYETIVNKLQIPVATCWDSIDLIESDNDLFCGRPGTMGNRPGNFAVQNSDFLLCIGNRLSIYQVGYDVNEWARNAYVVSVDIDENELKKPTIRVDLPICCDAKEFMTRLISKIKEQSSRIEESNASKNEWREKCLYWKNKYPVVEDRHKSQKDITNVYAFMDTLSRTLPEGTTTVVANGSASVVGSNAYHINKGNRFIMNCAISSMGYGLPAAIGAATVTDNNPVICIEGDGSIMMNLQEIQTIVTNKLPVKLFVINNNGYHQIRLTQNNIFKNGLVGVGEQSKDLGFPDFKKLADAFGIEYVSIKNNEEVGPVCAKILHDSTPVLCEVFADSEQIFEPKSATRKLDDGTLVSPPLEDMAPFLDRDELKSNMY